MACPAAPAFWNFSLCSLKVWGKSVKSAERSRNDPKTRTIQWTLFFTGLAPFPHTSHTLFFLNEEKKNHIESNIEIKSKRPRQCKHWKLERQLPGCRAANNKEKNEENLKKSWGILSQLLTFCGSLHKSQKNLRKSLEGQDPG